MNSDSDPGASDMFRADVIAGLSQQPGRRSLPSRYLYDRRGCELFEAICETPEYYPTRTELSLMQRDARSMAEVLGPRCQVVELGSGAGIKTQLLLDELENPVSYVPVDFAPDYLIPASDRLRAKYPGVRVEPVCANFAESFAVPAAPDAERTIVYFPGSTIGNFSRESAVELVNRMKCLTGPAGGMLIGVDLKKDVGLLAAAYNDAAGVTAQFTANMLVRMQRELNAKLDLEQFAHLARYNVEEGRIEIYLCSMQDQAIEIGDQRFEIANAELINTEYSYKYDLGDVQDLALQAGMALTHAWLDELNWFGVFFFSSAS